MFNIFQGKPQKPDMQEYSTMKSAYYSDWYTLISGDNPSKIISLKTIDKIPEIMLDEQVKACLAVRNYAVLSSGYQIFPAKKVSKSIAKKQADLITFNLNDWLKGSFNKILKELLSFQVYGYVIGEQNYENDNGTIYLKNIKVRYPGTYKIYPDEYGNLSKDSIKQWQSGGEITMPNFNNKFIHYAYNSEWGNPYGRSELEEVYRDWFIKNVLVKFESIYLEKFGTPSIIAKTEETKKEKIDEILRMFQKLRGAGTAVIPKGIEHEIIDAISGGGTHFRKAIEAKDKAISKALLMPDQLGFTEQQGGSYAKSQTNFNVFMWVINGIRQEIEDTIINEQVIRPLINYNFGEQDEYPKFKFNSFSERDLSKVYDIWARAVQGKFVLPTVDDEAFIRTELGMPERTDKTELLKVEPEEVPEDKEITNQENPEDDGDNEEGKQDGTGNPNKDIKDGKPLDGSEPDDKKGNPAKMEANKFPILDNMEKVNFEKINNELLDKEDKLLVKVEDIISEIAVEAIDRIENKKIITKKRFEEIDKFTLKYIGDLKLAFKKTFIDIYKFGRKEWEIEQEGQNFQAQNELLPDEYTNWLNSKAFIEAGKISGAYIVAIKQALILGIENGYSEKKIISMLRDMFHVEQIPGSTAKPIFTEQALQLIVRMNVTASFDKGRYILGEELSKISDYPIYYQFNEILEGRAVESHPLSKEIHGHYVLAGTELAQKMQYPLHYNDRGVRVTVNSQFKKVPEDMIFKNISDIPGIGTMSGLTDWAK